MKQMHEARLGLHFLVANSTPGRTLMIIVSINEDFRKLRVALQWLVAKTTGLM